MKANFRTIGKFTFLFTLIGVFVISCQRTQTGTRGGDRQAVGKPQGDFIYSVAGTDKKTITITGYRGTDTLVTIPSSIDDIPVTVIGTRAFKGSNITGVIIPASITAIRDNAFSDTNLNRVTFLGNMDIGNISNTYDMASDTSTYPFPGSGLNVLYPFRGPGTYNRSGNSWSGPASNQ